MKSLKEVYGNMVQRDHEKVAQHRADQGLPPTLDRFPQELVKQAQAYDEIGRVMARQAYVDLIKQALDEAGVPPEKQEDELKKLLSGDAGKDAEKKDEEKKDDGSSGDKSDEKKDDSSSDGATKEAARKKLIAKKKILAKMARDPNYVSQLIAKHTSR